MIWVIDNETKGLDSRKVLTTCILKENGKVKHFYNPKKAWGYILESGRKEQKRGKVLNIYAHNMQYDYYGFADLSDKNVEFFSFAPFIANYKINGKRAINFLDSYAIFKMPLKELGDMIDLPKLDLPEEFSEGQEITIKRLKELAPYVERDVEIVMKAIKLMKKKMNEDGVNLRRLYTISQIAIAYFVNTLKKDEKWDNMFFMKDRGYFHRCRNIEKIHNAYRGGRCECFQLGEFKKVDYIDINNLYGYASMNIDFPLLRSERMVKEPLKYFNIKDIVKEIGISRVLIHNKTNEIGILPVRTDTGSYYPKKDTYMIGTYTNLELKEAIKEGYKILGIEWSIFWDKGENPFKKITSKLYQLRKDSGSKFDNFFYKEMQNRSYGKMAQRKGGQEIVVDNVEKAQKYLKDSYEIIKGEGYNYIYKRDVDSAQKSYYIPIIPTLINAYARVYMYRQFKKIDYKDLIYTDTDSCIMKLGNLEKFDIDKGIGKFKLEYKNKPCIIKGRKTYAIGSEMKIAGFRKRDITMNDFKKGIIKSKKMVTLKTSKDLKEVGSFVEEVRDLNVQLESNRKIKGIYLNEKIFKDKDISNISYFVDKLAEIAKVGK
jgi:hypothetical protein